MHTLYISYYSEIQVIQYNYLNQYELLQQSFGQLRCCTHVCHQDLGYNPPSTMLQHLKIKK